jgi:hypothetical protein
MIAGGVGFIMAMLNLADFLLRFRILHFLITIALAILIKFVLSIAIPTSKDPMTAHPQARKFFYLSMLVLAIALLMRNYNIPYYNILLYVDVALQLVALGISFSARIPDEHLMNDDILDE